MVNNTDVVIQDARLSVPTFDPSRYGDPATTARTQYEKYSALNLAARYRDFM